MNASSRRLAGRGLALGTSVTLVCALVTLGAQAAPSSFLELDGNVVFNSSGTYDWANSGALTTTNDTWSRAGSGGVFNGGHFNGVTTPPTAPSRTAAAAADGSIADAEFKVDPLSVDVTSCGTGDPTVYTGAGSEVNGGLLSTDTFGTSSVPNKDDLSNVYALAHVNQGTSTNEVFFGGERVINNGDSHIDYEFLQGTVTIPAACSGKFSGDRTQGDFLLSVDFTTGGTLGGIHLYKWRCDTTYNAAHDGDVCNPPAHGQSVPRYVETGTTAVQIRVNDSATPIGCGGWVCRQADGTGTDTIHTNELMEGGIDLQALGFTGCVSTFLPHTRSSQSFTATLKDFEIIPFNTCVHPTITTKIRNSSGTDVTSTNQALGTVLHDTATLSGNTSDAGGTVTYTMYTAADCGGTATDLTPTTNTVTNGAVPDSKTFTFNNVGTYYFKATYSGDSRNIGPVDSGCNAEPVTIIPNTPAPHSTPVAQIKDTFSVSGLSSDATGNVVVGVYSDSSCSTRVSGTSDSSFAVSGAVNGTLTGATTFIGAPAGTYYFKISYAGDTNNTAFNSCAESVTISITSLA